MYYEQNETDYRRAARGMYCDRREAAREEEWQLDIDENAPVSQEDDGSGAWVQAWVFVPAGEREAPEIEPETAVADEFPSRGAMEPPPVRCFTDMSCSSGQLCAFHAAGGDSSDPCGYEIIGDLVP